MLLCPHSARIGGRHVLGSSSCQILFSTLIAKWQRRRDRLTAVMKRLEFPRLESFVIDGERFPLPLSSVDAPKGLPRKDELEYLVGFFDGDGCVTLDARRKRMTLQLAQRATSAKVLLRFRAGFGGGIYAACSATGFCEATLKWQIGGAKMRQAAQLMASVPAMKQAQLSIAAGNQDCTRSRLNGVAEKLKMLKRRDHIPTSMSCSWPYFAGFFDAEGSVQVAASYVGLRLQVGQVNGHVLQSLLELLHQNGLTRWRLHHGCDASILWCKHRETCNQTQNLLAHGLSVKSRQADLALTLTQRNHMEIRDAVSSLGGRQGRYRRLDHDGSNRAHRIHALQAQLRLTTASERRSSLVSEIAQLQEVHALQNLISHCRLLRSDLRQRLADGAKVVRSIGWSTVIWSRSETMKQLVVSFTHWHFDEKHNPDFRCQSLHVEDGRGMTFRSLTGMRVCCVPRSFGGMPPQQNGEDVYPPQKLCTARVRLHAKLDQACFTCETKSGWLLFEHFGTHDSFHAIYQGMDDVYIVTYDYHDLYSMRFSDARHALSPFSSFILVLPSLRGSCPIHHPKHCNKYV